MPRVPKGEEAPRRRDRLSLPSHRATGRRYAGSNNRGSGKFSEWRSGDRGSRFRFTDKQPLLECRVILRA